MTKDDNVPPNLIAQYFKLKSYLWNEQYQDHCSIFHLSNSRAIQMKLTTLTQALEPSVSCWSQTVDTLCWSSKSL